MLEHLVQVSGKAPPREGLSCVALAHNEGHILAEFLDHYQRLGVDHFLIVDDRSTDATPDILAAREDVSVFHPRAGSTYKDHKRFWRAGLLDAHCAGRWAVVPDIDEHLVYAGMAEEALPARLATWEAKGAQAIVATMVDMYADAPLDAVRYAGGPLAEAFPFFDGADHYHRLLAPRRFRARYPTPEVMIIGGMRQRMFLPLGLDGGDLSARFFRRVGDIGGPVALSPGQRRSAALARAAVKSRVNKHTLFNITKVPLVKWRPGLTYYNGAHALSAPLPLATEKMALLHYNFASGTGGIKHKVARGEHAGGAAFYQRILGAEAAREASPLFAGSARYTGPAALGRILGPA